MSDVDWANTETAKANRERKARRLATRLRVDGTTLTAAHALSDKGRRAVERAVGIASAASQQTWDRALELLAASPPVHVDHRPAGCDCTPNDAGILYQADGWPCPHTHPSYADQPPLIAKPGPVIAVTDERLAEMAETGTDWIHF